MCIDYRRRDILVPEQLLNRYDIGVRFQQMRRERVTAGYAGGPDFTANHAYFCEVA